MTFGLILIAAGSVLAYAGIRDTTPGEVVAKAFSGAPLTGRVASSARFPDAASKPDQSTPGSGAGAGSRTRS